MPDPRRIRCLSPLSPLLLGALVLSGGTALADGPPPGPDGHRGPPRAAVEACASLAPQAACTVETREGPKAGQCLGPPPEAVPPGMGEEPPLACVPDDAPLPGKHPPRD